MLERERIIEIIVAVSSVFLMLGIMMSIGTNYGDSGATLSTEGGELLVAAIIGFILLLTVVGIGLAFALNPSEDGAESDDDFAT